MMSSDNIIPFNPLEKRHLGTSVGQAMLGRPVLPLKSLEPFDGSGIYAIYYVGDFAAYDPLANANRSGSFGAPIYIGKAVPKGSRKGSDLELPSGKVLPD